MLDILVGADPELFVKKANKYISAYGLIKGDKSHPFAVDKGAVQVDGMALEFNINPAKNVTEFVGNIDRVLEQLKEMVPRYSFAFEPVARFDKKYFDTQPKQSKILGCAPDYNAWSGNVNASPSTDKPIRTAAGHIHIGWDNDLDVHSMSAHAMARAVTKQLDFFLGLPSIMFDSETERREMYGKAGAYRVKPYGAEYRVLSNSWLASKELKEWVYNNTISAMIALQEGNRLEAKYGDIQQIINTSNTQQAMEIIQEEGLEIPNV